MTLILLFSLLCMLTYMLLNRQGALSVPVWTDISVPSWQNHILYFADADEKTEAPTQKKLQESKKKGQVAKSQDLNAAIILFVCAILMTILANSSFKNIYKFIYICLSNYVNYPVSDSNLQSIFTFYILSFFQIVGITFAVVMVMGIISNLVQSGFIFTLDPLKPNLNKLNPVEGFKNLFSKRAIFNLVKTLLKFILIGVVAYTFIRDNIDLLFSVAGMSVIGLFPFIKDLIFKLVVRVVVVMLLLGIVDFIFQKYDYKKRLRMTKHEIKEEYKQMEGDPMMKSLRKQKQRQISMNRMMAEVSNATVVITNPTHLAIALRYEEKKDEVPIIVGKGADHVAAKIRELAKEKNIPIMENKPLAQVLYKQVDIGEEVPPSLYQAIAEILAVVMKIKRKDRYLK